MTRREESESAPAASGGVGPRANQETTAAARASGGGAPRATNSEGTELTRRDAIKLGATVALVALEACKRAPSGPPAPRTAGGFFTAPEFELVDELSEMIIPTDEHSPGARAAKVAAFIDGQLAEAWDPQDRTTWRGGLALVDRLSQDAHAKSFMQASADQRIAVLTRMAQNETKPQTPEDLFFVELKNRVVRVYYTTEIGMKQEMEYKGNVFLQEFVGEDVSHS